MSKIRKAVTAIALLAIGGTAAAQSFGSFDDGWRGFSQYGHSFGSDRSLGGSFDDFRRGGHDRRGGRSDHDWDRGGHGGHWGHWGGHKDPDVTSPVPEPSTYALMLAGLGVVAFMARRRRRG